MAGSFGPMTPGEQLARFPLRRRLVAPIWLLLFGALCLAWYLSASVPELRALFAKGLASQAVVDVVGTPLTPDDLSNLKPWSALVVALLSFGAALPYFFMPRAVVLHRGGLVVEGLRGRFIPWIDVDRVYDKPRTGLTGLDLAWCSRTLPKITLRGSLMSLVLDTGEPEKVIGAIDRQRTAAREG